MKIIMVLTNGFDPDVRVYKEAKYLVTKGHEVTVLCWDRTCRYKDRENELIEGIKIKRFFINSQPGSGIKQLIPYFKFIKAVKKYIRTNEYDYIHCHDMDGMIAGSISRKKNDKVIFDMHEFYCIGSYAKIYFIVKHIVRRLQSIAYKIINVNDKQLEDMKEKNKSKLVYLPNYPEKDRFINITHIDSNDLRITYAGYVRYLIPFTNLIKATIDMDNVKIGIHGSGEIWNDIKKLEEINKNLNVTGVYNHKEIGKFYAETDIIYDVCNKGDANEENAIPTKFFEAMICGIPVIVSNTSLIGEIVKKYDVGFCVDGTAEESIRNLIHNIVENREILNEKIRNIEKIKNKFLWEDVVKNLDLIYGDF